MVDRARSSVFENRSLFMIDILNYSSNVCQEQSFSLEPNFYQSVIGLGNMNITDKNHPQTVINFVSNLKNLLGITKIKKTDVARKANVSLRYIDKLLSYENYPTIEVAEGIGSAFGLTGWQMIMPDLHYELAKSGKLESLISEFSESSKTTQDFVTDVLHREHRAIVNGG